MKKITLLVCFLAISLVSFSQVLNQPANWPNANWTTSGTFTAAGLINDPSVNDSFTFDDDAAGSTSADDIASESPIIDLTAASTAGENLIIISGTYMHRDIGGSLAVQYWDADAASWVAVLELEGTPTPNGFANCDAMVPFETGFDVSGFTATQLSGFKYRYAYDDAGGWQWGWCIQESLIISGGSNPPNCDAVVTAPTNGETGVALNTVITWNEATGFPEGYIISIGTTDGGTDIVNNEDVGNVLTYNSPMLAYGTTYYVTITPYNGSGNATGCTSSSFTTLDDPSQTVDCNGAPINTLYCYDNNDTTFWLFTSSDGSPLRISFAAGTIEGFFDDITIYDGVDNTAPVLFNNNATNQNDLAGLLFDSTGDSIFIEVDSDGSVSCTSGARDEWDFTVSCATCVNPAANYTVVEDCINGPQFFVDVDLTDIGSATSITITDNQGSPAQTTAAIGTFTFGPFANNTDIVITVTNDDDANCTLTSPSLTQDICVLNIVDCTVGPTNIQYCYDNNDTTQWLFTSNDGINTLRIMFNAGSIEGFFDDLTIYDGVDNTAPVLFNNNTAGINDFTGLVFESTGTSLFLEVDSDGSVSCTSGAREEWDFDVVCATCTNPTADFIIVNDCDNGDQFLVDVDVTDIGDAVSLTISDDQGSAPVQITAPGVTQFGPYPFATDISITIANDDDPNCIINSGAIRQEACPPDNDNCDAAELFLANADGTCTEFASGTVFGATESTQTNGCNGTADDDVWYQFEAVATDHAIVLNNTTGALSIGLYEGDCNALTEIACGPAFGAPEIIANGLTVGNTYTVRVYSTTADPFQNITFDLCVFTIPPPIYTSTTDFTVEELVEDILVDSDCNQVFNITWSTGTDFGSTNGIGYFERNGSAWPFESGLIMTTGNADNAPGPEDETLSEGGFGWPGDADLEAIIPGMDAGDSNNATIIEFDFIPVIENMSFDFIFASEEYGGFQCPPNSFVDAFAFLLTDVNGVTTNLAIVPGTVDPISIFTVRDEAYNPGCSSVNPEFFDKFYGAAGEPELTSPTDFRGHTTAMTASAIVVPNDLYHIKLVIADDGDSLFDSAVFFSAGSFDIGQIDLGDDILLGSGDAQCEGDIFTLDAGDIPNNSTVTWYQDGVVLDGENGQTIDVSTTAFYRVDIVINGTDCTFSDEILIEFFPNPIVQAVTDPVVRCVGLEVTLEVEVTNSDIPDTIMYTWIYEGNIVQDSNDPTYVIQADSDEIGVFTILVEDERGCVGETTLTVIEGTFPEVEPLEALVDKCIAEDATLEAVVTNPELLSNNLTYIWYINGEIVQESTDNTYIHLANEPEAQVTVVVRDETSQCTGETIIDVVYYINDNCVDVPQGLSPNGDGINDCLILDHLEDKNDIAKAEIFNRYGTKVFELNNYVGQWCGTDQDGTILPVGTYFYIITFNSSRDPITSWIYLNY